MLKTLITLIAAVSAGIAPCQNCKLQDTYSGPFYSYGYCPLSQTCYEDVWNHPNAWCEVEWRDGYSLDLVEDCQTDTAICQPFTSSSLYEGKNLTGTRTLQGGESCVIEVDATSTVARIMIEKNSNLGVMFNGYRTGTFLTIAQGSKANIQVYNGKAEGQLDFKFIYTGAVALSTALGSCLLAALSLS